jgi:hypothetical protein
VQVSSSLSPVEVGFSKILQFRSTVRIASASNVTGHILTLAMNYGIRNNPMCGPLDTARWRAGGKEMPGASRLAALTFSTGLNPIPAVANR